MKGRHSVHISTKHLRYNFELKRNITIIRGDSATGKTTLVGINYDKKTKKHECMIEEYHM